MTESEVWVRAYFMAPPDVMSEDYADNVVDDWRRRFVCPECGRISDAMLSSRPCLGPHFEKAKP